MSWSARAADALSQRLLAADFGHAAPTLGDVWSVLMAWGEQGFGQLTETMSDEVELLWAWHEPTVQNWTYFDAPEESGEPLFGLSISRTLNERTGTMSTTGRGGARLDRLFQDGPFWPDAR